MEMRPSSLTAAAGIPSPTTIARACSHPVDLAAMFAISARRASEQNNPEYDSPPGSSPGIWHRVIHQGVVNTTKDENGDDITVAGMCVSAVNMLFAAVNMLLSVSDGVNAGATALWVSLCNGGGALEPCSG